MAKHTGSTLTSRQVASACAILAIAAVLSVIPLDSQGKGVREGDIAPSTLTARRDAQYESQVLSESVRAEAARKVEDVYFPPDPALRQQQIERLTALLDDYRAIRGRSDLTTTAQQIAEAANITGPALTAATQVTLVQLDRPAFDQFRTLASASLGEILLRPVLPGKTADRVREYTEQLPAATSSVISAPTTLGAFRDVLRGFAIQNVKVDQDSTQRAREEARSRVNPVIVTYSRSQVVAVEGKRLDGADIEALRRTGFIRQGYDFAKAGASAAFALGLTLLFGAYVLRAQPFETRPLRRLLVCVLVLATTVVAARIAMPAFLPDRDHHYLAAALPLAAPALVAVLVADIAFAAVVAAVTALLVAFVGAVFPDIAGSAFAGPTESLQLLTVALLAGFAGAVALSGTQLFRRYGLALVAVAAASASVLAVFWVLSEPRENSVLPWLFGASLAGGVGSTVACAVIAGLAGPWLGLTARVQLMRLSQSTHPLQRRLRDEAPGTYHHSQMVATLGERAADHIGADGLLTRVGAQYHDIGKLASPRHFIENQLDDAPSPHDDLPPGQSAKIIRDHVSNGVAIARQYRLPLAVAAFVPEHHGTRLVSYFYRRAAAAGLAPEAAHFRYGGPKPQTREAAIVMLADSSEALVRAHEDRGNRIDELVDGLFAERIAEGQLDECDLTMRELRAIATSFKETLRAVYHPRVPYPAALPDELARLAGSYD